MGLECNWIIPGKFGSLQSTYIDIDFPIYTSFSQGNHCPYVIRISQKGRAPKGCAWLTTMVINL